MKKLLLYLKTHLATLRVLTYNKIYISNNTEKEVVDNFHKLYYSASSYNKSWNTTKWRGVRILKCPLDLWVYHELIYELKPELIIETGTSRGGSAMFLADMLDQTGKGMVVTVDIRDCKIPEDADRVLAHKRIKFLIGSSTSPEVYNEIKEIAKDKKTILVILDATHNKEHVLNELQLYAPLVTTGSYVVVEDTNFNGHPVFVPNALGEGPYEAVEAYLKTDNSFVVDDYMERHFMTFNPKGYLKKIS
jgi:cephalosporin hydroxylase